MPFTGWMGVSISSRNSAAAAPADVSTFEAIVVVEEPTKDDIKGAVVKGVAADAEVEAEAIALKAELSPRA